MSTEWEDATQWELRWWGNCINSLNEEEKQKTYAVKMGLKWVGNDRTPYEIDSDGKSVVDIGAGPCSLLLKCRNTTKPLVVDPCKYPDWVYERYDAAGIYCRVCKAEDLVLTNLNFDEAWMYNVLQHVEDPEKIVQNVRKISKIIRVFDWLDRGVSPGHPHNLTFEEMNGWFHGRGKVEVLNQYGLKGKAYYGIFKGLKE